MVTKMTFLAGLGTGYVLGARAGRQRYEQIASTARGLWQDPRVQQRRSQAQQVVKEQVSDVADKVTGPVKDKVQDKVQGGVG